MTESEFRLPDYSNKDRAMSLARTVNFMARHGLLEGEAVTDQSVSNFWGEYHEVSSRTNLVGEKLYPQTKTADQAKTVVTPAKAGV